MNATPTVGIANTTCGLPRADAMSVLRDPSTGDYPWPSMILQCGLASAWYWICDQVYTPGRRQSKTPILLRNVDQKSFETEFLTAICRHTGDKWQSKTLFLSIFDPRSSVVDSVFDCRLPGVVNFLRKYS